MLLDKDQASKLIEDNLEILQDALMNNITKKGLTLHQTFISTNNYYLIYSISNYTIFTPTSKSSQTDCRIIGKYFTSKVCISSVCTC